MATRKESGPKNRTPRRTAAEYRFKIDAYTPETMPMARLAEYMAELAVILGERAAVHFVRLEPGSTTLVHKIEREAVPKVRARVNSVRRGDAPTDALRAYKTVNKFLREDDGVAAIADKSAVIIRFPGRDEPEEKFPSVREAGTIDGVLIRMGGSDETIHVTLEVEGRQIFGCYTGRAIAKQLGHHFFEPVRLAGRGSWSRDGDGNWTLRAFRIDSFDPLDDAPLSTALTELRKVPGEWGKDAYDELHLIRHGPVGKTNGGH